MIDYSQIHKSNFIQGFNLLELMVTLSISITLMMIAVPSYQSTVQNNQLSGTANDLYSALSFSRNLAINQSSYFTICASVNLQTCSNSTNWATGWIIFKDRDGDTVFEHNGNSTLCETTDDCLIRVWDIQELSTHFTGNTSAITFDLNGLPLTTANFSLYSSNCSGQEKRTISVNSTGRANVTFSNC
ncbi:MAG: GspH/FimT family pseudopilin [Gammaproteobacteria bacterium]|nr:GspH/FimT family pseudopilin [Gammaproteobacteria bacterium]